MKMPPTRSPRFEPILFGPDSNVDVVAVPAIGAHHRKTWIAHRSHCWLEADLPKHIPRARVLLYDHGELDQQTIESLGERLLNQLVDQRRRQPSHRPLFFICHSTGGLVAKQALALAARAELNQESKSDQDKLDQEVILSILTSCYGIAFLATPHQGSSYLSADEYAASIRRLLHLEYEIPPSLREQFRPRQEWLRHLSNKFTDISADIKVWTFLETVDSTLRAVDKETGIVLEFHAPITSIRSGLLDIEHENEVPMATNHVSMAKFHNQESVRDSFLAELGSAAAMAVELSWHRDTPLEVEKEVQVQVNGFFEDTALGVSDETPLKLWSIDVSLQEYLARGPSACLRERLLRANKIQLDSYDDSSRSSFDSPHSSVHVVSEAAFPEGPRPTRPSLHLSQSFIEGQSPRIHISAPIDGVLDRSPSESRPPPVLRKRKSISERLGLNFPGFHQRSASDSSSQTSSSRPQSRSASPPQSSGYLSIPVSTRDRINQNAEMPDEPRSTPRFDRPESGTEKLLWIHVPYTHTGWVSKVIKTACHDRQEHNFHRKFINDENWYQKLNRARHLEPHARFVQPLCIHSRQMDVSQGDKTGMPDDPQLALYVPYLHWDTYRNLIQRRKVVEQRLHQGRTRPVPERISQSSLEAQLIWKYLGCEPPIHFRRTLDQFGYPNLRSTVARDDDQMLWKRTRKLARIDDQLRKYLEPPPGDTDESEFMDGKVLMVDQLWLWIVDQKTVVTFFPNQEATTSEGKMFEQSNLHNSIYNELNGDLARRFETAGDLAALIMLHAVTVLLGKTLHRDLQVLRIFEESISILTESVTKSFKRFRNRGFATQPADHNRTLEGKMMTAAERDQRDKEVARRNREDLSVLLELRDIEDELATILKLLDQQETVIKSMIKYFDTKGYGKMFLDVAMLRLDEYHTQISEMRENAYLTQKAVETHIDLKQKQASVDEAKMARWQAETTQNQSRSVMVFTIFTVIFLPLSFFTSLFGINAREWSNDPRNLTLSKMFEIAAPASLAIILVALLLAFSEDLREAVSKSHKIGTGLLRDFIFHPIRTFLHWDSDVNGTPAVVVPQSSALRKRFDNYLGYGRHNMQIEDDIWEHWQKHQSRLKIGDQGKNRPRGKNRDEMLVSKKVRSEASTIV